MPGWVHPRWCSTISLRQAVGLDGGHHQKATLAVHTRASGGRRCQRPFPTGPGLEPGTYPFSKIVEANGLVFLAGQVGDVPGSHGAVPGGIEAETRAMLDNVGRLLKAVGLDYSDVVKCTVYLRDFDDFADDERGL